MNQPSNPPEADKALAVLETLATTLVQKRADAIASRQSSGIEEQWVEDEEHYQGYDDANRHEYVKLHSKPGEGGNTTVKPNSQRQGSTVFPNITQPYCDAASARVGDMLMPTDDRNFVIEPTPIPEMAEKEEQKDAATVATAVQPLAAPAQPGMAPAAQLPGQPAAPGATAEPPKEPAEILMEQARKRAKAAQTKIDDYLTECQFHDELRMLIDDAARIGTGALMGPYPAPEGGDEFRPASRRVDCWDVFPDWPACGDNIQNGGFLFVRDRLTERQLMALKGIEGPEGYLDSQIDAVLQEGPSKSRQLDARSRLQGYDQSSKTLYEVWYYYGFLKASELEAAGCDCGREREDGTMAPDFPVPALITLVNDRIIKAALNPLDSGEFPVDMMPWKRRPGMPWGSGVGRQGRTPQRIVVAAARALMDNAGASAKPYKVLSTDIEQDGDPWTYRVGSDMGGDPAKAMMFFTMPSVQAELMNIIAYGEQMMEKVTGMPAILMGMQGDIQETAKGRTIQNNNGNSVLRRIARLFDSYITEPHIRRYYEWLKTYDPDPEVQGDFQIKARASSALVERDIQNQNIPTVMQMALNPAFEMSPRRSRDEWLKSMRFSPEAFDLTDAEKQAMASRQPPPAPQVEAAKIREQGATERKQMELQHKSAENQLDRQMEQMLATIDAELETAGLSLEERTTLAAIKASLAEVNQKLRTQIMLSPGKQVATPGAEPAGRAPNGQAFVQ